MRRTSLTLIALVILGTVSASAEQTRRERKAGRTVDRVIRFVKPVFRMKPNGDILLPPVPAPAPPKGQ